VSHQYRVFSLALLFLLGLTTHQCLAQGEQENAPDVRNFHFKAGIHQTFDKVSRVEIWSFDSLTDSKNVTRLRLTGLKNWSSKPATAVKLSWYLIPYENYKDVIKSGQTKLIDLGTLAAGETVNNLDILVVSSVDVFKSLKGDIPKGELFLGIAVSEIHYADGSIWKLENERQPASTNSPSNR
jgi:hypothetical protein